MGFTGAAVWHEEGDDLIDVFPKVGYVFQAHTSAVQTRLPASVVEPGDVPAPFKAAVEQENLTQEFTHAPKVVFGLVGAGGEGHRIANRLYRPGDCRTAAQHPGR